MNKKPFYAFPMFHIKVKRKTTNMKEQSVIFIRLTPSDKKKVKTACVKRNKTYSEAIMEWVNK
jgi:hypothetical protein